MAASELLPFLEIIATVVQIITTPLQIIALFLQFVMLAVIGFTAWVYHGQLLAMRNASEGDRFLTLVQILQDKDVRQARRRLLVDLEAGSFDAWSADDREAASLVSASYGVAGVMLGLGLVNASYLEGWGPSIRKCYEKCVPLLLERRKAMGEQYGKEFTALYNIMSATDRE